MKLLSIILLMLSFIGVIVNAINLPSKETFYNKISTAALEEGFRQDGYNNFKVVEFQGKRGIVGFSVNTTLYSDGSHKPAYYVEGTDYQRGYLTALLAPKALNDMCSVYIEHELADMIDEDFDEKHKDEKWYQALIAILKDMVIIGSYKSFENNIDVYPSHLINEMKGLVDGAKSVLGSESKVTVNALVALNFGIDYLLSHVYAGKLKSAVFSFMNQQTRIKLSPQIKNEIINTFETKVFFKEPVMCDSFTSTASLNADKTKTFFARDFQQPNGMVFQKYAAMSVHFPEGDNPGYPFVTVGAPGFVGSVTAMNSEGVSMGVDIIRSALVNPESPGINSILLVRHVIQYSKDVNEAIDLVASLKRGCSWLYPISDAKGNAVIIEAGRYEASKINTLDVVTNQIVKQRLPSQGVLDSFNSPYKNGIFYRTRNFTQPKQVLSYNENLFELANIPYPTNWGIDGYVFSTFIQENKQISSLLNNWFPPQRKWSEDLILCSNHALTPEMRVGQMSRMANFITKTQHASQWRYDKLNDLIHEVKGQITMEHVKDIITFLSPDKTPGYFHHYYNPNDIMSAAVEGTISVAELKFRIIETKSGYFADDWTRISLPKYYKSS